MGVRHDLHQVAPQQRLTAGEVALQNAQIAGLDHVQVSIQADEPTVSDRIAGTPSFDRKIEAMNVVKELGWPLTMNVVLHRQNIDRVADVLRLAEEVDADRVELANTQYYGWA